MVSDGSITSDYGSHRRFDAGVSRFWRPCGCWRRARGRSVALAQEDLGGKIWEGSGQIQRTEISGLGIGRGVCCGLGFGGCRGSIGRQAGQLLVVSRLGHWHWECNLRGSRWLSDLILLLQIQVFRWNSRVSSQSRNAECSLLVGNGIGLELEVDILIRFLLLSLGLLQCWLYLLT